MACPTLADLPMPLPGKTGWPWTESRPFTAENMHDAFAYPRVSVVTPSYNQGEYLEETIRSVLLQGYPNLEYIVIDGGSTDRSLEIIRKYERWLDYWVSEPDRGQVFAVDKGWRKSTGEILAYLNSDDTYLPNAIHRMIHMFSLNPQAAAVNAGDLIIDREGMVISERLIPTATLLSLLQFQVIPQPATFVRREYLERAGGLDLQFQHSFDFEFWTRLVRYGEIVTLPDMVATTRWHTSAKTFSLRPDIALELERIINQAFETPEARKFSTRTRRVIYATMHFWMATIYLDNWKRYPRQAITNSICAVWHWPPTVIDLMRFISGRTRTTLVYYFLKYVRRKDVQKVPWGYAPLNVHWSVWSSQK